MSSSEKFKENKRTSYIPNKLILVCKFLQNMLIIKEVIIIIQVEFNLLFKWVFQNLIRVYWNYLVKQMINNYKQYN